MSATRDQILRALANVTPDRYVDADHVEQALGPWADLAEKAGLRPPARTVRTVEDIKSVEIVDTVLLDESGDAWQFDGQGWQTLGGPGSVGRVHVEAYGPFNVLHLGGEPRA